MKDCPVTLLSLWQIDAVPDEGALLYESLQGLPGNKRLPIVYGHQNVKARWWQGSRFVVRNYAGPVFLIVAWAFSGIYAGMVTGHHPFLVAFSSFLLFFLLSWMIYHYMRKNCYLFIFFNESGRKSDESSPAGLSSWSVSENKTDGLFGHNLEDYLEKIRRVCAQKGTWRNRLMFRIMEKCGIPVYIRSYKSMERISRVSLEKSARILGTAIHFNDIFYVQKTNDNYYLAKLIFNQRLPEVCVALCSLWALSFGFYQSFGAVVTWSLLAWTMVWFTLRALALIRSLRIWAPILPFMAIHTAFQNMKVIAPDLDHIWPKTEPDVIQHGAVVAGLTIQVVNALYLILFVQLVTWKDTGFFWRKTLEPVIWTVVSYFK